MRRGTGTVMTWRRAQMVLLSAQGMPVAKIAEVRFTSPDRVRDVLHNSTADGFGSVHPRYAAAAGGRPYTRACGVRHLLAALDLARDRLYGHVTRRKGHTQFLAFCRYLRSLYPADVRIAIIWDNFSPHLTGSDGGLRVACRRA